MLRYRIRQIEAPSAITKFGAKTVMFSPDSHWLCAVRLANVIVLAKLVHSDSARERPRFSGRIVKLTRSDRDVPHDAVHFGLDAYRNSICRLAFSPDSRVLAVGDLAGRTDTWLLEGYEDTMQAVDATKGTNLSGQSKRSSSTSSDEDDSDHDHATVIHGQKWIPSPGTAALPRLDSAVLVLSFRPGTRKQSPPLTNGNIGLHATRHTPHPYSHDLPIGDAKLVAVTARNQVAEFDVLKGGLSDWSRRNPVAYLPPTLKTIKDPAMGSFWSAGHHCERLWLYGATWLFMLDMSQDLPDAQVFGRIGHYDVLNPVDQMRRKRSRSSENLTLPVKRNTGAGDVMHPSDTSIRVTEQVLMSGAGSADHRSIDIQEWESSDSSGDDDDSGLQASNLALMRRHGKQGSQPAYLDGPVHVAVNGAAQTSSPAQYSGTRNSVAGDPPVSWYTFQYRAILGIVPIGQADSATGVKDSESNDTEHMVEVAIVECPMWDVEYPPRFDGGQDWET